MTYNKLKDEDHKWKMQVSDAIDNWPDRVDEKDKRVLESLAIKVKYQFPAKCTKYKNGKATSTKMVYYDIKARASNLVIMMTCLKSYDQMTM